MIDNTTDPQTALDMDVVSTRVCGMVFGVPPVQVVSAPFDVSINFPPSCKHGDIIEVQICLQNKQPSLERVSLSLEMSDSFLVTGSSTCSIDILPFATTNISFSLVPLKTGHVSMPHILLMWERSNVTILEVGTKAFSRTIFVKPKAIDIA